MTSIKTTGLTKAGGDLRADHARRTIAMTAGLGLLAMAVLAPLAHFDVLQDSVHRVLPDATHDSLIEDEGDAALASQAILDVVQSVRAGTPLANP